MERQSGSDPRPDPTKMANQPALQTSSGTVWIVVGGLFLLASLVSFGAMVLGGNGQAVPVAIAGALLAVALYTALVVARFSVGPGTKRLRVMAICMLTMAFTSLLGIWICALIEGAALETAAGS